MAEPTVPYPLFPPLGLLNDHAHVEQPINLEVRRRLELVPEHLNALKAWQTGMGFLMKQSRRSGFQDRHYKMLCPIIESMMHWSWSIRGIALADWDSADARAFDDPGLSSKHHRNWFLTHGREYFAFTDSLLTDAGTGTGNPFRDLSPKDFEARTENRRTILTSEQLSDLMEITESLANYSEKLEPFLFIVAAAVHSDIPMRALTATQTIKPTFSYFKPRDFQVSDPVQSQPKTEFASSYLASRLAFAKGPGFFESPLYLGRRFHLSAPFQPYFQRYAQFRHQHDPLLSAHSYLLPLMHGIDAYGYGSLIEKFSEFTASILQDLRARPASARMHWKGSDKLDPSASLTFAELRESAKRAGLIPKGFVSQDVGANDNVWPDIGIRQDISKSHWFQTH
ncbi:hypothetical protein [Pseudomonas sp. RGM 3321]|uniref:hypothetical protein n=1 Tax=Pseudomonas sp. RGM 3321 TaxID=2930089 RepID=UPI001FCB5FB7|nr:hypothetical protein [Pseudomonas sp. RGM 3321]MCJ2370768.1 hypothetical protein [Pseudomonas sp. RGM 3321]